MKALIAAACLVVIAGGVYYAAGEIAAYNARAEREADREAARAELFKIAHAEPGDVALVIKRCRAWRDMLDDFGTRHKESWAPIVHKCRALGYL